MQEGSEKEESDENSVIEDLAVLPAHTNFAPDPPEVFGTVINNVFFVLKLILLLCGRLKIKQRSSATRTSLSCGS